MKDIIYLVRHMRHSITATKRHISWPLSVNCVCSILNMSSLNGMNDPEGTGVRDTSCALIKYLQNPCQQLPWNRNRSIQTLSCFYSPAHQIDSVTVLVDSLPKFSINVFSTKLFLVTSKPRF